MLPVLEPLTPSPLRQPPYIYIVPSPTKPFAPLPCSLSSLTPLTSSASHIIEDREEGEGVGVYRWWGQGRPRGDTAGGIVICPQRPIGGRRGGSDGARQAPGPYVLLRGGPGSKLICAPAADALVTPVAYRPTRPRPAASYCMATVVINQGRFFLALLIMSRAASWHGDRQWYRSHFGTIRFEVVARDSICNPSDYGS